MVPAAPATLVISNSYSLLVLKVKAPVDNVPTVLTALPGATLLVPEDKATVPLTEPFPPSLAPDATVTALLAFVLPLTNSVPEVTVVVPVYVLAVLRINIPEFVLAKLPAPETLAITPSIVS